MPKYKYMFTPINFYGAGIIFIILGIGLLFSQILAYFNLYFSLNGLWVFMSVVLLILGTYLVKVVGKL